MKLNPFIKRQDNFDLEAIRACKSCGNSFQGRYCNICGEKVIEPHERTFVHFLDSLLNAFTFLDGKFMKSMKLMLAQPGLLSRKIADGVRVPYMKMVSLFFVANFFYFLFPSFDTYNSSLHTQLNSLGSHSVKVREIVNRHMEEKGVSMEEFQRVYIEKSTNLSKLLIVVLVLMLTGILMAINYSSSVNFFDHLLFSLEFYSFQLLVNLVGIAFAFKLLQQGFNYLGWGKGFTQSIFPAVAFITMGYFLFKGQMNFYGHKWGFALIKAILIFTLIFYTVHLYRVFLFYITMWFV